MMKSSGGGQKGWDVYFNSPVAGSMALLGLHSKGKGGPLGLF